MALLASPHASGREPILLPSNPAVSPDGTQIAFAHLGDIWLASAEGGEARRLTLHPGTDREPSFSPDGKRLAFISDRETGRQVFVMDLAGGAPRQLTFHTEGYAIEDWFPDSQSLLVSGSRDHYWRDANRFFRVHLEHAGPEEPLFDAYGSDGRLSPDGTKLLFVREGERWWRKGYRGSRAAQIWCYDLASKKFTKVLNEAADCRWPLWMPDGEGFYYTTGGHEGFNLWELRGLPEVLKSKGKKPGTSKQLTRFPDDSVVFPAISRDGSTLVFRHLFDLYRFRPGKDQAPVKLEFFNPGDQATEPKLRRTLTSASEVSFTEDGLEIAFIAGGDVWVMDTELKEPRQLTDTPEEESEIAFSPDGKTLLYVSEQGGQVDLWKVTQKHPKHYWWERDQEYDHQKVTDDPTVESAVRWSHDGKSIFLVRGRGELWRITPEGKQGKQLVDGFDRPDYDISPDDRWVVYSHSDDDFNREIWIAPTSGDGEPFNVSRHPDDDYNPVWSPDGKLIAFTSRRYNDEIDIYYVWLREDDFERTSRDRKLAEALEKLNKARKKREPAKPSAPAKPAEPDDASAAGQSPPPQGSAKPAAQAAQPEADKQPPAKPRLKIDFEGLEERLRRIPIADAQESQLFWSPDSKKLAFAASINGKRGIYTLSLPASLTPQLLSSTVGSNPVWLKNNSIVLLSGGKPAAIVTTRAATSTYSFRAYQEVDQEGRLRAAFDQAWRVMRDSWYDEHLGNRNWEAVRRKYREMAGKVLDHDKFTLIMHLMLGELNGSHLGFMPSPGSPPTGEASWSRVTPHLGLRFEPGFQGPGLKVRDVIADGPAAILGGIHPGDVILEIDGVRVDPGMNLPRILNGRLDRQIDLLIQPANAPQPPAEKAADNAAKDNAEKAADETGKDNAAQDETGQDETGQDETGKDDAAQDNAAQAETAQAEGDGQAAGDKPPTRTVSLRPISYAAARNLLYEQWLDQNEAAVSQLSAGKLGYLHIRAMNQSSFLEFERQLYAIGYGKDGLVIDVRQNGGGSTTDLLLTCLTQPQHAITVPRDGGPGYPQSRKVFATWNKPIVVLCNQNSYSNAEIFSHAIKGLKRGKLVGVPTAGGVVSTGAVGIMDLGTLRLPFRGWYVLWTGEDMELNGAVPHHVIWPLPGELPAGKDRQLEKAVQLLKQDVTAAQKKPQPQLRKATERKAK